MPPHSPGEAADPVVVYGPPSARVRQNGPCAPPLTLDVLRLSAESHRTLIDTFVGDAVARIEPFGALGFELGLLWEQVDEG